MLTHTTTALITGLDATTITVEVDLNRGKPQLIIIGLASQSVSESKERITSALLNSGITPKSQRTIVNLAPADIKKSGTSFDLSIAIALLKAYKKIHYDTTKTMFFGELSLDGSVKKIRGLLPLLLHAKRSGMEQVFIPKANQSEVIMLEGIKIYPIQHLRELLSKKNLTELIAETITKKDTFTYTTVSFEDIYEQQEAKYALEIAAAGGHNTLLTGPPGTGKSMLANALVSILPPLDTEELIEVNSVYSVAGLLENNLLLQRPFRSPHHSITIAGMLGGGTTVMPGEISLSHRGVLFMDEIPEFPQPILESLRQPLESGVINISRVSGTTQYPCEFMLVAASNPCPCGYKFSQMKSCVCNQNQYLQYKKRLSGPILDRVDLKVFVKTVDTKKISEEGLQNNEKSANIKQRVIEARKIQSNRYKNEKILTNSQLSTQLLRKYCPIEADAEQILKLSSQKYQLSTRAYFRVIKVARTIADLQKREVICYSDIAQALQFKITEL